MAKRSRDENPMDAAVRVKLTEEQVADRGRALAEKLGIVKTIRDMKKADNDRHQTMIDAALDEAEAIRLEILEGAEEKRQGDLFVGEEVATQILAGVVVAAGEAEPDADVVDAEVEE